MDDDVGRSARTCAGQKSTQDASPRPFFQGVFLQLSPEGEKDVVREAGPDFADRLVLLAVWLVARQQIRPVLPCTRTKPPRVQEGHRGETNGLPCTLHSSRTQVIVRFGVGSKALVLFTQVGQILVRLGVD